MAGATTDLLDLNPAVAARQLSRAADPDWLAAFVRSLELGPARAELARVLKLWDLSQARAAVLFGVSRQALSKWLQRGVPADRIDTVARLAAATDILARYLKADRIAAVVRRPAPALDGRSLIELVEKGRSDEVLAACRRMFAFEDVQAG